MIAWISGAQDPQFVPHLSRSPIVAMVAAGPSCRAQAAMVFRPTPKHEQISGP
jgi:hypothetical protein